MWIARVGSVLFILLQQVILIDIGYNWNESWLAKSDQAELDEGPRKGKKWLGAIIVSCAILYICSLAGIIIMYIHFSGCQSNNAFISITLILSLICTAVQLTISETGSLLTSGCMTIYATYLCGAAVATKNPLPTCNPMLGETSTWSIVVGLLFALISLTWTGFSYTSDKRLGGAAASGNGEEGDVGGDEEEPTIAGGVVLNNSTYGTADTTQNHLARLGSLMQVSLVLVCVSVLFDLFQYTHSTFSNVFDLLLVCNGIDFVGGY